MKKYISAVLIFLLIFLAGCGEEEEQYASPNFNKKDRSKVSEEESTPLDASITDALFIASLTDATPADATPSEPASLTDASIMGLYDDNSYYNSLAGFKISVDDDNWKFYDAEGVASATNASVDYINNLWYGYKSPYDADTTYAAICYNTENGSNIIVSYINPASYLMPYFDSESYLKMASETYKEYSLGRVTFLGDSYVCLDVKDDTGRVGRRTQFATDKEGLIVLITLTLHDDEEFQDAIGLFAPIDH